jgi:hypothetical protein
MNSELNNSALKQKVNRLLANNLEENECLTNLLIKRGYTYTNTELILETPSVHFSATINAK